MPDRLVALIPQGQRIHPGDARLRELITFLVDPVDFLTSPEAMARESSGDLATDPRLSAVFHMVRGSRVLSQWNCPGWTWIDLSSWPSTGGPATMLQLLWTSALMATIPESLPATGFRTVGVCGAKSPRNSAGSCNYWGWPRRRTSR